MESFRHSRKRGADEELRDVSGLATRAGIEPAGYQGVVSQAFSMMGIERSLRERKIRDKKGKIRITALPLSYPAGARAGLEPATGVIFRAFAERGLPTRDESELLRRATIAPLRGRRRRDLNPQPSESMESLSHSASGWGVPARRRGMTKTFVPVTMEL